MIQRIKSLAKTAINFTKANSSTILSGIAVAGVFTTAFLVGEATPKAMTLIADAEEQKAKSITPMNKPGENVVERTELTVWESMKATWKCYIPAILSGGLTVACIIGANNISHKKEVALTAACKLTESAFSDYKAKAAQIIGEEKEREIQKAVNEDNLKKQPQQPISASIIINGSDECEFFEAVSQRKFMSTVNKIEKARNDMNFDMSYGNEYYKSFNEWLDAIGVEPVPYGDDMGFSIERGGIDTRIDSYVDPDTMKPTMILDYGARPVHNYDR